MSLHSRTEKHITWAVILLQKNHVGAVRNSFCRWCRSSSRPRGKGNDLTLIRPYRIRGQPFGALEPALKRDRCNRDKRSLHSILKKTKELSLVPRAHLRSVWG